MGCSGSSLLDWRSTSGNSWAPSRLGWLASPARLAAAGARGAAAAGCSTAAAAAVRGAVRRLLRWPHRPLVLRVLPQRGWLWLLLGSGARAAEAGLSPVVLASAMAIASSYCSTQSGSKETSCWGNAAVSGAARFGNAAMGAGLATCGAGIDGTAPIGRIRPARGPHPPSNSHI